MAGGVGIMMRRLVCCGSRRRGMPEEGRIRVYVGREGEVLWEMEMETNYLKHPLVEKLLVQSGDEFGYSYAGALRIFCDVQLFRYLLQLLNTRNPSAHYMDLQDLISKAPNSPSSYT